MAKKAALAFNVSKIVSTSSRPAPPSSSARLEIATVNLFDDLRLREVEQFVVTFEILALPILEPFAAELLFAQPILLDDRAHRPVEDDEALAQETRELFNSVDLGAHARG